jgi:hypothetical protein
MESKRRGAVTNITRGVELKQWEICSETPRESDPTHACWKCLWRDGLENRRQTKESLCYISFLKIWLFKKNASLLKKQKLKLTQNRKQSISQGNGKICFKSNSLKSNYICLLFFFLFKFILVTDPLKQMFYAFVQYCVVLTHVQSM